MWNAVGGANMKSNYQVVGNYSREHFRSLLCRSLESINKRASLRETEPRIITIHQRKGLSSCFDLHFSIIVSGFSQLLIHVDQPVKHPTITRMNWPAKVNVY
jgi:hypothetical protein